MDPSSPEKRLPSSNLRDQLQTTVSGSYTLERELGGGGMSRVFVAEELRLRRKVVIKVLSPELAEGISVERFEREIQTAAALQQANIVPVLFAGETNGLPFFTMPFVEGESLRAQLARGPLPVTEVIGVLRDVTRALAYAHQRGIVHRDIKPDNVLMSAGAAMVTDFGIAKAISAARLGSDGATLTQVGTSVGTPAYMAPEQAAADPLVDHRADIYALGAMAYELLTGQPVFADRSPQRMIVAHLSEAPKPVSDLRANVPAPLADLVMRCLAKDPDHRPQTAGDISWVLDTLTSGSGMLAMPPVLFGGPGMFRKALAIYGVTFVAVAILAKAAIVGIGLPDWVLPGALVVMALGLPMVLWTGYVQRVTQQAMTATPRSTPDGTRAPRQGTLAAMAMRAAPRVSWHRTARSGLYGLISFIVLVGVFMALRATGIGPFGSLLAAGKLNRADPILLTDFRTANVDSSLGRVVSDAVRAGLSESSALTLVSLKAVVATLRQMRQAPTARVDSALAREIAVREGVKAIVDGDVTGVAGGYIVSIRLVRADSGVELASFREAGDGPRGLIDAADRLARALRGKVGESLRAVNAAPPLAQVTTTSLDALKKYSEASRANMVGDPRSIALAREAVAIDSTFAFAWGALANFLNNYNGTQSAIDSAITQAFRYRDRLPDRERDVVIAEYYLFGPGRDRSKAAAAYETRLARGDSSALISLGESVRSWRMYARAESLNVAAVRRNPRNGLAMGNIVDLQLDQGKLDQAETTLAVLRRQVPDYKFIQFRAGLLLFARGDFDGVKAIVDSLRRSGDDVLRDIGIELAANMALLDGRLREGEALLDELAGRDPTRRFQAIDDVLIQVAVQGPSAALSARLDSALAAIPFTEIPLVDRPYLRAATALARTGAAAKARAMIARYRVEVIDTALRRQQTAELHQTLGEVALAEGHPQIALIEFRLGDVGYDGKPADECAPCLSLNLARAFDAAGQGDSAAAMFEQYLATPYWQKAGTFLDPVHIPEVHERLGQLYQAMGAGVRAAEHYRKFVHLWKGADALLQPRVVEARRRAR